MSMGVKTFVKLLEMKSANFRAALREYKSGAYSMKESALDSWLKSLTNVYLKNTATEQVSVADFYQRVQDLLAEKESN
jgi:hypothetical protein